MEKIRSLIYNMLFLTYILSLVLPIPHVHWFISLLSLFALLLSLIGLDRFYQIVVGIALTFSFVLLFMYDLVNWGLLDYFSGLTNILVLIAYASLFSIPVHLGVYPRKIYLLFKNRVSSFRGLYATFSSTTFLFCSVMAAAAIPTIRSSLHLFLRKLPEPFRKEFQSITFVRPFILTLFWSPVAASPTVAISKTGANALTVLSITFSIAILFMFMDILTSHWRLKKKFKGCFEKLDKSQEITTTTSAKTKVNLAVFISTVILFILIVLSMSTWLNYSILDSVILMIIPYTFIWSLALKRGKRYFNKLTDHFLYRVPKISTQVALFVSVGFLINVIGMTGLAQGINSLVSLLQDMMGPFILVFISVLVVILTWLGILPQLVVVLFTQTLNLQELGLNPEWFVLAILAGALAGSASSPFTVNANIVSVTIDESPKNIVKYNLVFSVLILLVPLILAVALQFFS